MTLFTHWHVGSNPRGGDPDTPELCLADPADAVRALGEAIDEWVDAEHDKPEEEQDRHFGFAATLAEIFIKGSSPEFFDEVMRVRQRGTGYSFGGRVHWAVPAHGCREDCDLLEPEGAEPS